MALQQYVPTQWVNKAAPAINAVKLNHIEVGIEAVTDEVLTLQATVADLMPVGAVIAFSGATIPTGWALCNGTQGTPNLVGKFLLAGNGADSGATGGSADAVAVSHSHVASFSGNALAPHTHTVPTHNITGTVTSGSPRASGGPKVANWATNEASAGTPSGSVTVTSAGVSGSGKNLPPYYKLAYIMKIA